MDVVSLGTVAADDVEILVNGTHTLSVGKDVLLRSSVLGGLRLPLQSSASIDVEKGYIQCYCGHVQQCSGKLSNLPDATESLILLLKAADSLGDEGMVSAVAGELSQRLLTGSSNGTKKRKREDDEDKVIDQQTTICPVTSEALSQVPPRLAAKVIQVTGLKLDVCFEKFPSQLHTHALEAHCPNVATSGTLSIDGSPGQWSQDRLTGGRLPDAWQKNRPMVRSKALIALLDAVSTMPATSSFSIALPAPCKDSPGALEVSEAFGKALAQLPALIRLEVRKSLAEVSAGALSRALSNMKDLECLILEDAQLSCADMAVFSKQLKGLSKLKHLGLAEKHIVLHTPKEAATFAAALPSLTGLQHLDITGFQMFGKSQKRLSMLSSLTALTCLKVESIGMVPDTVPEFAEALKSMCKLRELSMRYNQLGQIHVNSIPRASEVPQCVKPLCSALLSLKDLCSVDLSCTHLGYGGAKHVVKELVKFGTKKVRGRSLDELNLEDNMQSIQLYSEFYRKCAGGHPDPADFNKVFRHSWIRINASNWM